MFISSDLTDRYILIPEIEFPVYIRLKIESHEMECMPFRRKILNNLVQDIQASSQVKSEAKTI